MKAGIATAARMPMIATTIINSMRVNPRLACLMSFIYEVQSNGCAAAKYPDLRQVVPRRAEECHSRGEKRPAAEAASRKNPRIADRECLAPTSPANGVPRHDLAS